MPAPILDPDIKRQINHYLKVMLSDNVKARVLQSDGTYCKKEQKEPFVDSRRYSWKRRCRRRMPPAEEKKGLMDKVRRSLFGKDR